MRVSLYEFLFIARNDCLEPESSKPRFRPRGTWRDADAGHWLWRFATRATLQTAVRRARAKLARLNCMYDEWELDYEAAVGDDFVDISEVVQSLHK